jgi:hypothetical protein
VVEAQGEAARGTTRVALVPAEKRGVGRNGAPLSRRERAGTVGDSPAEPGGETERTEMLGLRVLPSDTAIAEHREAGRGVRSPSLEY